MAPQTPSNYSSATLEFVYGLGQKKKQFAFRPQSYFLAASPGFNLRFNLKIPQNVR
jgi:hypothetical protein